MEFLEVRPLDHTSAAETADISSTVRPCGGNDDVDMMATSTQLIGRIEPTTTTLRTHSLAIHPPSAAMKVHTGQRHGLLLYTLCNAGCCARTDGLTFYLLFACAQSCASW
jgi:hypothetical protein